MTTLREAAQQALEALAAWDALIEHQYSGTRAGMSDLTWAAQATPPVMEALRAALAEPEQEPAALLTTWVTETEAVTEPLYKAAPPLRTLTDAEIGEIWFSASIPNLNETAARRLIRAVEARLGGR
jgi:hypothetical protein